jgi:phosphoribosylanthranilate isomerase
MWIKICGNRTLDDVEPSVDAAADAVGFVFAPGPRQVKGEQVAALTPSLPRDLTQIGVFRNRDFAEIAYTVRTTGLNGVQLHGGLDLALAENLRREFGNGLFLIQSLHWRVDEEPEKSEQSLHEHIRVIRRQNIADAILLDARTSTASGGTGRTLPWTRAREVIAAEPGRMRIILAGGLTPENVTEAIGTLRPWGVDVSSGVERQAGSKDPARVRAFITAARTAFAAIENRPLAPVPAR